MKEKIKHISEEDLDFLKKKIGDAKLELKKRIMGMDSNIEALLLSILASGHVLLEGMPGLAKTMLAKAISQVLDSPFQRVQFTPDLLPADLTGTIVFNPKTATFDTRKGPVFTGVLLADEINRAPAKVQSALLQCMEERMVTLGDKTYPLDPYFFVMATQNHIDEEGTYQLPEAQMDRFLIKLKVGYPSLEEELSILTHHGIRDQSELNTIIVSVERERLHRITESVFVEDHLKDYIIRLVQETRPETAASTNSKSYIRHGASPRASIALIRLARAHAAMEGRDFVIPEDIQCFAKEVLRHRILLRYEALAEEIDSDIVIESLLENVRVP